MRNAAIPIEEFDPAPTAIQPDSASIAIGGNAPECLPRNAFESLRQHGAAQAFIAAARISETNAQGVSWSRNALYDRPYP